MRRTLTSAALIASLASAAVLGPSAAQQSVPPWPASTTAEACHVFKTGPATVYSLSGNIGAAGWIMVFNATSAPADGAVTPITTLYASSQGTWSIVYPPSNFSVGVVVCASSTGPLTKTAYATNTTFQGVGQ